MRTVLALAMALGVMPTTAGAEAIELANDIQAAVDLVFIRQ
jgi:hypothetical protein